MIKYYCEIIQCFYNETHTEEEVEALATKIRGLYDADLIANQDEESYLESVKVDILSMAGNGMSIRACSITWLIFSICFLDAISGTTPPYTVWSAICE